MIACKFRVARNRVFRIFVAITCHRVDMLLILPARSKNGKNCRHYTRWRPWTKQEIQTLSKHLVPIPVFVTLWSPFFTCFKSLSVFCFTGVLRLPLWLYNCLICIYLSNQCLSHLIVLFLCLSPCIHVFSIDKIDSLYITEILYSLSTDDPINLSCFVLSTWTVIL